MPMPRDEHPKLGEELRNGDGHLSNVFSAYDQQVEVFQKKQYAWLRDMMGRIRKDATSEASRVIARRRWLIDESGVPIEPAVEAVGLPFTIGVQVGLLGGVRLASGNGWILTEPAANLIPRVDARLRVGAGQYVWPQVILTPQAAGTGNWQLIAVDLHSLFAVGFGAFITDGIPLLPLQEVLVEWI